MAKTKSRYCAVVNSLKTCLAILGFYLALQAETILHPVFGKLSNQICSRHGSYVAAEHCGLRKRQLPFLGVHMALFRHFSLVSFDANVTFLGSTAEREQY